MEKNSNSGLIEILTASSLEEIWENYRTNLLLYCCTCGKEKPMYMNRWLFTLVKIDTLTLMCTECKSGHGVIGANYFSATGYSNKNISVHFSRRIKKNDKVNFRIGYLVPEEPSSYKNFNVHIDSCMNIIELSFEQVKMLWEPYEST